MIVIFPFSYFDNFYALRYGEQIRAIADNVEELNIPILYGVKVDLHHDNINFYYEKLITNPRGVAVQETLNLKQLFTKYFMWNYMKTIPRMWRVSKRTAWIKGDIVLGYSGSGGMEIYHNFIGLKKNIPVVHRMRGYGKYERKINNNLFGRFFNDMLENIAYKMYDYHIPITSNFKRILLEQGINQTSISEPLGIGVNTDMFKPENNDEGYIGYFGRISKEKGSELFLELAKKTPHIKYLVAGENFEHIIFPDNVTYVGRVRKTTMPKLINKCRAIIQPSKSEGYSNGIIESYACGKIVIGSKRAFDTSMPKFYTPLELDVSEWIKAVESIDCINLNVLQNKARQFALNNTWSSFGVRMVNELKKVKTNE